MSEGSDNWVTVQVDAAHYVDQGVTTVLCDRLPRPLTLVLKNPALRDGDSFPSAISPEFRTSLADRGGESAEPLPCPVCEGETRSFSDGQYIVCNDCGAVSMNTRARPRIDDGAGEDGYRFNLLEHDPDVRDRMAQWLHRHGVPQAELADGLDAIEEIVLKPALSAALRPSQPGEGE